MGQISGSDGLHRGKLSPDRFENSSHLLLGVSMQDFQTGQKNRILFWHREEWLNDNKKQ